ncbi:MAG: hypothetical protein LQ346_000541 [Caloplaca aetnensis]|nr:MAG: hypothetical protein LQ346_000541 [Caloplaca aetnensis]
MLPSAKSYLHQGGLSPQAAAYAVIGCFLGGVVGIQLVSRVMHHYIPSHVVDCDHSHDEPPDSSPEAPNHATHDHQHAHADQRTARTDEQSPLLAKDDQHVKPRLTQPGMSASGEVTQKHSQYDLIGPLSRRPSLQTRVSKLVSGAKSDCEGDGPCFGYSDPCAQECLRAIFKNPMQAKLRPQPRMASQPGLLRTATAPYARTTRESLRGLDEEDPCISADSSTTLAPNSHHQEHPRRSHPNPVPQSSDLESNGKRSSFSTSSMHDDTQHQHHHHVPTNAFLSIGLQTSIAIALHKLPEGFITFATNHANPKLGFAVFMALFIHNITEGFAMALPLYLAIGSRWKSMFWSSLLGGASQPFGAGVAALWFKVAGSGDKAPGETVYGCMFAITSGIMASVALQLFAEGLTLNHNRNLCLTFAFMGMGVLGISFALTA